MNISDKQGLSSPACQTCSLNTELTPLFIGFLGVQGLDNISATTTRNPKNLVPERRHFCWSLNQGCPGSRSVFLAAWHVEIRFGGLCPPRMLCTWFCPPSISLDSGYLVDNYSMCNSPLPCSTTYSQVLDLQVANHPTLKEEDYSGLSKWAQCNHWWRWREPGPLCVCVCVCVWLCVCVSLNIIDACVRSKEAVVLFCFNLSCTVLYVRSLLFILWKEIHWIIREASFPL